MRGSVSLIYICLLCSLHVNAGEITFSTGDNTETDEYDSVEESENNSRNIPEPEVMEVDNILPKACGSQTVSLGKRIIGGKEAAPGEYPWMVRLYYKNNYNVTSDGCSGFLIHSKFVITAAHCTHPYFTKIKGPVYSVILGSHNKTTEKYCFTNSTLCTEPKQMSRVVKVINHPEYNHVNSSAYNDIAIIRITRTQRSDFVRPICLLTKENLTPPTYYLSGWGITEHGTAAEIKMKVEVPPFEREACKVKYSSKNVDLTDTQICAGGESQKDSCTGDSGGPLMISDDRQTYFAAGIVSFGMDCGEEGWPGVYTNIAKFLPWIKSEVARNLRISGKVQLKRNKSKN